MHCSESHREPVSYTHLDVYKRQLTGRATIAKGRVDMPEPRDEEEASERDDTGP